MTVSTEPSTGQRMQGPLPGQQAPVCAAQAQALLPAQQFRELPAGQAQGRLPDFFVVGSLQERDHRAVRDAPQPPTDLYADEGAVVLRARAALTLSQGRAARARTRSRSTWLCSPRPARSSARGRPRRRICAPAAPRRASRRCSPPRASSRSCASPPAICARCTYSSCRPTSRPRPTCARRSRSRSARRRASTFPVARRGRRGSLYSEQRALRRAAASLPRGVCTRAGAGVDL